MAAEHGYPDPINPTYETTTKMYYKVADDFLHRIQEDDTGRKVQTLFATHNEDTVQYIINRYLNKTSKVFYNISRNVLDKCVDDVKTLLSRQFFILETLGIIQCSPSILDTIQMNCLSQPLVTSSDVMTSLLSL